MTPDSTDATERFTRCWTAAQPAVAGYLSASVPDFRDAQDLLQVVAVICLRKFHEFDEEKPFVRWALGIAHLEILKLRRNSVRSKLVLDDSLLSELACAAEQLGAEFEHRAYFLRECLQGLDPGSASLIRLRYEESLSPALIAERVGRNNVAVRVSLTRIRAGLRRCIEQKIRKGHS